MHQLRQQAFPARSPGGRPNRFEAGACAVRIAARQLRTYVGRAACLADPRSGLTLNRRAKAFVRDTMRPARSPADAAILCEQIEQLPGPDLTNS